MSDTMPDKNISNDYELVWSDDFDGLTLDKSNWNVESHASGWIKDGIQEYCDDNIHARTENGMLVISPSRTMSADGSFLFKSARISTFGKREFKYGKFEARIKMAKGKGIQPMFKLLPAEDYSLTDGALSWPESGSIIAATTYDSDPSMCYGGLHFGKPHMTRIWPLIEKDLNLAEDFHVFTCEWNPDKISFSMDGKEYFSESYWFSTDSMGGTKPYPAPFNKPFHIVFSVSVGGRSAGAPDTKDVFDAENSMYVDYIKVWQKKEYDENVACPPKIYHMRDCDKTGNYILNSEEDWEFYSAAGGEGRAEFSDDYVKIESFNYGDENYSVQLYQSGIPIFKNTEYVLSFEAKADEERAMSVAITAPDMNWLRIMDDTSIKLETEWQQHIVRFDSGKYSNDDARVEFNIGNSGSNAAVRLRNIRLAKAEEHGRLRRPVAVCGVWEDSDNYNLFMRALAESHHTDEFIPVSFTFGTSQLGTIKDMTEIEFAKICKEIDPAAIIIFGEMIKSDTVIRYLIDLGNERKIPVFMMQHQTDGVINIDFNYKDGFEKIVRHVMEEHKPKTIEMFAGFRHNPFSEERIEVFKDVITDYGIRFNKTLIHYGDFWDAKARELMNSLLDDGYEVPEAIVCANDSMAIGVCDSLKAHGYKIPDDVIVTGFDGISQGKYNDPILTTGELDYDGCIERIYTEIKDWHTSKSGRTEEFLIDYTPSIQYSCGCKDKSKCDWRTIVDALAEENQDASRHMLEMGHLTSLIISYDNIDEAANVIEHLLWLWRSQYYYIGIKEGDGCMHACFTSVDSKTTIGRKFYGKNSIIPDFEKLIGADSGFNVILCKSISTLDSFNGLIVNSYRDINLRSQQRFEEFALFVGSMFNSILNNRKLIAARNAIADISEKDYLTSLYNRRGFFSELEELLGDDENNRKVLSLFSIDMDNLKTINDNYGHQYGDIAIQAIARALAAFVGTHGIAARYGGDEFACAIIGDTWLAPDIENIRARIHTHIASDPQCQDLPFKIMASIGISEHMVDFSLNLENMIRESDTLMYKDKQSHKLGNLLDD